MPCVLCGNHEVDIIATIDRHGRPLQNVLCRECGLVWVDPRPSDDELNEFYAKDYRSQYKGAIEPKKKHCYREMLRANQRVDRLKTFYKPGDRLLDVGAGAGFFAYVLAGSDVDVTGIEPSRGYATFARDRLDLKDVKEGYLQDVEEWQSFDIITINHVFEHLPNPAGSLQHMRSLLKEGGVVIMEVPNSQANYHAPDRVFHVGHLYWYDPQTISALAVKHGFSIVDLKIVPDTSHINIVLRKENDRLVTDWRNSFMGNYKNMHDFFEGRSKIRHYLSYRPYLRFLRKITKYAGEFIYVSKYDDKITLINSLPRHQM